MRNLSHAQYYEVLREFMSAEEGEADTFRKLATKAANPRLKSLLVGISTDAKRHADELRSIYHDEYTGTFESLRPVDPEIIKLVKEHIRKEEEAVAFYEKMAKDRYVPSPHRLIFAELAADERRHHSSMEILISLAEKKGLREKVRTLVTR